MSTHDHLPAVKPPSAPSQISRALPVAPAHRPSAFARLWEAWCRLTGPTATGANESLATQEQRRRARLISAVLALDVLALALLVPSALTNPRDWFPVLVLGGGGLLTALLNRRKLVTLSAVTLVLLIDGALAGYLLLKPALSPGNLSDFDLLLLAVLVGGMILPRRLIPLVGAVNVGLILGIFAYKPPTDLLVQEIQTQAGGHAYVEIAGLLILQICGTGIAWLHAWSVGRALVRADRAEELARAERRIADQARQILDQKTRLEEGIAQLLETHRQIAGGNLAARTPTSEDHELWQVGWALNNLLGRFQRQTQENQELAQTCQEIEELLMLLEARRRGLRLSYPHLSTPLGTRLLQLLGD
jgi:hypothetical protein